MKVQQYLEICERAARAGGSVLQQHYGRCQAREKAPANLVTEADLASQATIRQILLEAYPDHGFIGEEDEPIAAPSEEQRYCWVVDPLDGTTNFAHGVPRYAVSVALLDRDEAIAGVVLDPVMDHCFVASVGAGAFLNGQRIRTSGVEHLSQALVAASLPAKTPPTSPMALDFARVSAVCQATRRTGSAALDLAYLASGWFDGCWAAATQLWDVAAGMLLVQEAGGVFTGWRGETFDPRHAMHVAGATAVLQRELCSHLEWEPEAV